MPGPSKESIVSRNLRIGAAFAVALTALVVVPTLAGCGSKAASTSSPPAATESAAASSAPATYLEQAQQVLSQLGATAGALPDAIAGLSKAPDDTWIASGAKVNDVATQVGAEASSLAALTPPSALQPVQDAVVKGLQKIEASLKDLSGLLYEQSATEATAKSPISTQVAVMKAKLLALSAALSAALGNQGGTPSATPTP
jgi:hypothetical protein